MKKIEIKGKRRLSEASSHRGKGTMSSTKTICRQDQNSLHTLPTSSVAFPTSSCHEGSVKTVNNSMLGVSKVTRSLKYIAYIYIIILCCSSFLSVVIATSDAEEGRYSDSTGSVIDNIPHRPKGRR